MKLVIKYQNGEKRVVGLHPAFFGPSDVTITQRVSDIAFDCGKNPYDMEVFRGTKQDYHRVIIRNMPVVATASEKVDERDIKKALRREFKNVPFSQPSLKLAY